MAHIYSRFRKYGCLQSCSVWIQIFFKKEKPISILYTFRMTKLVSETLLFYTAMCRAGGFLKKFFVLSSPRLLLHIAENYSAEGFNCILFRNIIKCIFPLCYLGNPISAYLIQQYSSLPNIYIRPLKRCKATSKRLLQEIYDGLFNKIA